ncbi:MAG: hypothetical protein ABGY09_00510 [Euryarchaeota archaeon]
MPYYRRLARSLVREASWAAFQGTVRVIRDRVLAYVHVTRSGARVVVPSRFSPGLRRELRREVTDRVSSEGPLRLYRRLIARHLDRAVSLLEYARSVGHVARGPGLLASVRLRDDSLLVSLLGADRVPFALTLEFPLPSRRVWVLDAPDGEPLLPLAGRAARLAHRLLEGLARIGVRPRTASSRF